MAKKTNNNLNDKNANPGFNNYTKYANDLDKIPNFYAKKTNGSYYWCIQFIDWLFIKAFNLKNTKNILFYDINGNNVEHIANIYKQKNRWYFNP